MYGFLSRYDKNENVLLSYVTEFTSILMKKIIENDKCNDIFYIDTDQIFYFSDKFSDKIIDNILNNIYDYDKKIIKNIFFIQKKRYFIFDPNTTIIKGFSIPPRIKKKKIYNLAYNISNSSHSYNRFFSSIKNNKENYKKYLDEAETILNRESKLKRILKI